jgi:hypothetical protein
LIQLAGVAQSAHQAVMSLNMGRLGGDGRTKGMGCTGSIACAEQIDACFAKGVG